MQPVNTVRDFFGRIPFQTAESAASHSESRASKHADLLSTSNSEADSKLSLESRWASKGKKSILSQPRFGNYFRSTRRSEMASLPMPAYISDDDQQKIFSQEKEAILRALERDNIPAEAIEACNNLLQRNPNSVAVLSLRAIAFRLAKENELCVKDCNSILQAEPGNRLALLHRASAHACYERKEPSSDRSFVRHVLAAQRYAATAEHDRFATLVDLLLVSYGSEKIDHAISRLEDFVKRDNKDTLALAGLVAARLFHLYRYADLGEIPQDLVEEVTRMAETLIALDPNNLVGAQALFELQGREEHRYLRNFGAPTDFFIHQPLKRQDEKLRETVLMLSYDSLSF